MRKVADLHARPVDNFKIRLDEQVQLIGNRLHFGWKISLKHFNLAYDLLLFPKHLPSSVKVVEQFPEQRFVLDHIAKPMIRAGMLQPWKDDLRELAKHKNVFCKISGLVTEAQMPGWKADDFRPYLDVVIEAFGEDCLMFGSDWPVCVLGGGYAQIHELAADYFKQFSKMKIVFNK